MPAPKYLALSNTTVEKASLPEGKTAKTIADGQGLEILIERKRAQEDGKAMRIVKTWRFYYHRPGQFNAAGKPLKNTMVIGTYPATNLDAARERASILRGRVEAGVDPYVELGQQRAQTVVQNDRVARNAALIAAGQEPEPIPGSFRQMVEDTFAHFSNPDNPDMWDAEHARAWRAAMKTHLCPTLGDAQVVTLTAERLLSTLQQVASASLRSRLRSNTGKAIALWKAQSKLPPLHNNIAADVRPMVPRPLSKNHPRIKDAQVLAAVYAQVRSVLPTQAVAPVGARRTGRGRELDDLLNASSLLFEILVWQRGGMVNRMEWSEIDFAHPEGPRWTVPATKMKLRSKIKRGPNADKFDHVVPLTPTLEALLRTLQAVTGHRQYVLSRRALEDTPMGKATMRRFLYRQLTLIGLPTSVTNIHGLRSMGETMVIDRCKVKKETTECHLAHIPAGLGNTYNDSEHVEERLIMLQKWEDFIEREVRMLTAPANDALVEAA